MSDKVIELANKANLCVRNNASYVHTVYEPNLRDFVNLMIQEIDTALWTNECNVSDLAAINHYNTMLKIKQQFGL